MGELRLGQRVRFNIYLKRGWQESTRANPHGHYDDTVWYAIEGPVREGIIIGKRTVSNGERHWIGPEEGSAYIGKRYFPVYLIAFDLGRKPQLVRPEDITALEEE
jgi:hypothetical protein